MWMNENEHVRRINTEPDKKQEHGRKLMEW